MVAIFLLLLLISKFSAGIALERDSTVSRGSFLSPDSNSFWLSSSGIFAFGFYSKENGFAIGIWLEKIQQKTVIWTAKRDDPPLTKDVSLLLTNEGKLVLQTKDGQETEVVDAPQSVFSASMLNTGNFVLYGTDGRIIWQSFDVPTDTILPDQRLLAGNRLLSSNSSTDHSTGNFQLSMQKDGNLVLYPVIIPLTSDYAYWDSETFNAGDNVTLNLDGNGDLYLLNSTGFVSPVHNHSNVSDNAFYRLTIDFDGILRLYSHSLSQNDEWVTEQSLPSNDCEPPGRCGLNSYCTFTGQEAICACSPGFDFVDQKQKNLGCKRNFSSDGCLGKNGESLRLEELEAIAWEDNSYSISPSTKAACRTSCLVDCNCDAAVFKDQQCKKQRLPLRFGRSQDGDFGTTIIKVGIGSSETRKESRGKDALIGSFAILAFALIVLAITGIIISRHRVWKYKNIQNQVNEGLVEDVTLRSYTYDELEKATKGFTDELGRGAFGTVFKGTLANCGVVAIKRLETVAAESEREFLNEMRSIGRTYHKNLVKLFGYCHEGSHRLLVYEFMSNGSLANFIFKSGIKPSWEEKFGIALNIARGIHYLHEECETQIIHCDIKPENILMDEHKGTKVADFGLAKLLMPNQTRTYTGVRGTRGYVAPEWHRNLPITVKADVYSFGIMLFEIICDRRKLDMDSPENEVVLADWVYDCFAARELDKLVKDENADKKKLERMVRLGLWCIQDEPSFRPSMKKVVLMLEGTVEIPPPPSPNSFLSSMNHG